MYINFGTVAVQDLPIEGGGDLILVLPVPNISKDASLDPVLPVPNTSQDANLDPVLVHPCQGEDGLIPDLQTGVDGTVQGLLLLLPEKEGSHLLTEGICMYV